MSSQNSQNSQVSQVSQVVFTTKEGSDKVYVLQYSEDATEGVKKIAKLINDSRTEKLKVSDLKKFYLKHKELSIKIADALDAIVAEHKKTKRFFIVRGFNKNEEIFKSSETVANTFRDLEKKFKSGLDIAKSIIKNIEKTKDMKDRYVKTVFNNSNNTGIMKTFNVAYNRSGYLNAKYKLDEQRCRLFEKVVNATGATSEEELERNLDSIKSLYNDEDRKKYGNHIDQACKFPSIPVDINDELAKLEEERERIIREQDKKNQAMKDMFAALLGKQTLEIRQDLMELKQKSNAIDNKLKKEVKKVVVPPQPKVEEKVEAPQEEKKDVAPTQPKDENVNVNVNVDESSKTKKKNNSD